METLRKAPLETLVTAFDFSAFLNAAGHAFAQFSSDAAVGIHVIDSVLTDDVVTLTVAGGSDGGAYQIDVTADTLDGASVTLTKTIVVEGGLISIFAGQLYLDDGTLLLDTGSLLLI